MKLEASDTIETYSIGSDISDKKSSISEENVTLVLQLVSRGIYRNPIGSILREITSNCVDAYTEIGVKKPVLVNINYDIEEEAYYIEFIDKGVGMSPDRMDNVYSNFFSSTKRDSNSLIGGFGIGSKSILSYSDIFYITTIYDNIKYEYVYYKDGDDYILSLLNKFNVLEKSGTTIKLYIKNGDESKFIREINQQLSYFENVYVNVNYRYESYKNDFTIYEGNHFKFKSVNRPYEVMHVLLGQVTYPIDFKELGIDPIEIPIALKFNIGELKPTLERENIKYEPEYIQAIKDKIHLALEELKDYFKDQTFELTDLRDYVNKRENTPYLYFDKEKDHKIKAYRKHFAKSAYVFKPLGDIDIPGDNSIFFMYNFARVKTGDNVVNWNVSNSTYDWKRYACQLITKEEAGFNSASTSYFRNEAIIFISKKFTYREAIQHLNLNSYKYNFSGIRISNAESVSFYQRLAFKNKDNSFFLGKAKLIHKYVTEIRNYVNSVSERYEDVPLDYIENYREEKRREAQALRNLAKEKIVYRDRYGSFVNTNLEKLLKFKYIFYCLKEENFNISLFYSILKKSSFKESDFIFINISNTQYQKIKKQRLIHMNQFIESPKLQNVLYKIKLANYIQKKLDEKDHIDPKVSLYHHELKRSLESFSMVYRLDIGDLKVNTHRRKKNCCWEITSKLEEYLRVRNKFNILNYVYMNNIPEEYLKVITKTIKLTKLNSNLYK